MFKFMLMFRQPDDLESFENSYNDLLALVERMPNIRRRQVVNVIGSPMGAAPFYRILEAYYDDQAQMEASLLAPAGQEAGRQLMTFPEGSFETVFAEVFEEAGGQTRKKGS